MGRLRRLSRRDEAAVPITATDPLDRQAGRPTRRYCLRRMPTSSTCCVTALQFERLRRGLAIYNEADLSQVVQQLLAPEVVAGLRMDLNRPFGDGRDNGDGVDNDGDGAIDETGEDLNGDGVADTLAEGGDTLMNGIVDDPLEAGDPFADAHDSANGRWDRVTPSRPRGEEFYDMDGNGEYTPPLDRLWSGLTAEEIFFDYNHGSALLNGRLSDGRPMTTVIERFYIRPNEPRMAASAPTACCSARFSRGISTASPCCSRMRTT